MMIEGHHIGKITATVIVKSNSGSYQLVISLVNEAGDIANAYLSFSKAAQKYTRKQLEACGFPGDNVADIHETDLIVGNKVEFDVAPDTYEGKIRLKVGMLFPVGGSGTITGKLSKDEAEEFGAALRAKFGRTSGGGGNLDDIPFAPDPVMP